MNSVSNMMKTTLAIVIGLTMAMQLNAQSCGGTYSSISPSCYSSPSSFAGTGGYYDSGYTSQTCGMYSYSPAPSYSTQYSGQSVVSYSPVQHSNMVPSYQNFPSNSYQSSNFGGYAEPYSAPIQRQSMTPSCANGTCRYN